MPPSIREQRDAARLTRKNAPPPNAPAPAESNAPAAAATSSTPPARAATDRQRPSWVSLRGPHAPQGISPDERSFSQSKSAHQKLLRRVKRQAAHYEKTSQWVCCLELVASRNLQRDTFSCLAHCLAHCSALSDKRTQPGRCTLRVPCAAATWLLQVGRCRRQLPDSRKDGGV